MNKSELKAMSLNQLRHYVKAHRHDREAWDEYVSRPRPNATIIPADIPIEKQQEILENLLKRMA